MTNPTPPLSAEELDEWRAFHGAGKSCSLCDLGACMQSAAIATIDAQARDYLGAVELLVEALAWYEAYEEVPAPRSQTRKVLARLGYSFPTTPEGWADYWKAVRRKRSILAAAGHVSLEDNDDD